MPSYSKMTKLNGKGNGKDCEKCGEKQTLKKIPSQVNLVKLNTEKKVGSLVKKSIEEFRQDLEQEKENLRNEFYTTDE